MTPDLVIRTSLHVGSGYGSHAAWIGKSLEALGVSVGYLDIGSDARYLPPEPFVAERTRTAWEGRCRLQLLPPQFAPLPGTDAIFTTWETSRLGPASVANLNSVARVLVPSSWNAESFRASGVTVPIDVVPHGIDPAVYHPRPFRDDGLFVVGMAGRLAHGAERKGLNEGIAAFLEAFTDGPDVCLVLKVWPDCLPRLSLPDDPRIVVDTTPLTDEGLADWYGSFDVYLAPTKGEGFGLHTLAAMAVGRPVIIAPQTGTAEFFTEACGWPLAGRWETAGDLDLYGGLGEWFVPDPDATVEALRSAHASPDEVRRRGQAAAERAAGFTWWKTGERLNEVLMLGGAKGAPPLEGAGRR